MVAKRKGSERVQCWQCGGWLFRDRPREHSCGNTDVGPSPKPERERRSTNDIAYDIVQAAPHVEELVEEWFAVTAGLPILLALGRIRAAALSDEQLQTPAMSALRDFLLRETSASVLPGVEA